MTPHDDLIRRLAVRSDPDSRDAHSAIAALVAELDKLATLLHSSTRLIDQYQSEREATFAERDEAISALVGAVDSLQHWTARADEAEAERDAAHALLRRAVSLAHAMVENDPHTPVSDLGHTALDLWHHELARIDALLAEKEGTT